MRKIQPPKKRKKIHKTYLYLKKQVFFTVFFIVAIIGLILPLRPKTSTIEKRTLTTFPKFTLSSFLNGDFLTGVSTWYSDTFPFREALLNANSAVKNLYGIQGEQIVHNSGQTGDEIPTGGTMVTPESESDSNLTASPVVRRRATKLPRDRLPAPRPKKVKPMKTALSTMSPKPPGMSTSQGTPPSAFTTLIWKLPMNTLP